MQLNSYLFHSLWRLHALPQETLFRHSSSAVGKVQSTLLKSLLRANENTIFGSTYRFSESGGPNDFRKRVPLSDYSDYQGYVVRVESGEESVLTAEPVNRFHLTSGTISGSKRIPFTAGLRQQFLRGIAPWMGDLYRQHPEVLKGRMYWVVTPPLPLELTALNGDVAVPSAFDQDLSYLPAPARWGAKSLFVTPEFTPQEDAATLFRYCTAYSLLAAEDLTMISLWNASYFTLLLGEITSLLPELAEDLQYGHPRRVGNQHSQYFSRKPLPKRAQLIRSLLSRSTVNWEAVWPNLRLISCWGDGWAASAAGDIQRIFPQVTLQPKGLLATEGIVTIPFADPQAAPALAFRSHFFEFIRLSDQAVCLASELRTGEEYEVVITTAGGLYRYQLGDIVQCEGHFQSVPRLRFLGRKGIVSDMCGEKLDEFFVAEVLREALGRLKIQSAISFLTPITNTTRPRYLTILSQPRPSDTAKTTTLATEIDTLLKKNIYYQSARNIGQLASVQVAFIDEKSEAHYRRLKHRSGRASTMKLQALDCTSDWLELGLNVS